MIKESSSELKENILSINTVYYQKSKESNGPIKETLRKEFANKCKFSIPINLQRNLKHLLTALLIRQLLKPLYWNFQGFDLTTIN